MEASTNGTTDTNDRFNPPIIKDFDLIISSHSLVPRPNIL